MCEAPSPAAIKAWLQDTATQEQINLASKSATANKLVYMECLAGTSTKLIIKLTVIWLCKCFLYSTNQPIRQEIVDRRPLLCQTFNMTLLFVSDSSTVPQSPDFVRSAIQDATGYDATFWMFIAMAVILVICLSGFVVSCVTLSRVKNVQRDQKQFLFTQIPRGYQAYLEMSRLLE